MTLTERRTVPRPYNTRHQKRPDPSGKALPVLLVLLRRIGKKHLHLTHPLWLVACILTTVSVQPLAGRNLWQADILHHCPHDGQATGFCREGINLIGALSHIAKEAFNRVGTANVAMHDRWKGIKGQQMLLILAASLRIASG